MTFPVSMDLRNRSILLVGGGAPALAKLRFLVRARALVTMVAEYVDAETAAFAAQHRVEIAQRRFIPADGIGQDLAFIATGDRAADLMAARIIHSNGGQVNVVDQPEVSTFILAELPGNDSSVMILPTESVVALEQGDDDAGRGRFVHWELTPATRKVARRLFNALLPSH